MQQLLSASAIMVAVLGMAYLVVALGTAFINRQDENRTREFRRAVLLAEAEAFRAATRNAEAQQVNVRG